MPRQSPHSIFGAKVKSSLPIFKAHGDFMLSFCRQGYVLFEVFADKVKSYRYPTKHFGGKAKSSFSFWRQGKVLIIFWAQGKFVVSFCRQGNIPIKGTGTRDLIWLKVVPYHWIDLG